MLKPSLVLLAEPLAQLALPQVLLLVALLPVERLVLALPVQRPQPLVPQPLA